MPINRSGQKKLHEATGDGGTTVDIARRVAAKDEAVCYYDGLPVDLADITLSYPGADSTRFTFGFALAAGVKIKIFA